MEIEFANHLCSSWTEEVDAYSTVKTNALTVTDVNNEGWIFSILPVTIMQSYIYRSKIWGIEEINFILSSLKMAKL